MKKFLFLIFLLISVSFLSFAQESTKANMKTIDDIRDLYKEVNHFPLEPHYGVYISAANVNFEVRVNDKPVFVGYEFITNGMSPKGSYIPINNAISKSGIQTVEVLMNPAYNRETEQLEPSLKNAQVVVDVVRRVYDIVKSEYGEEEVLESFAAPVEKDETTKRTKSIYPERQEFSFSGTFEAAVPYNIKTLDNAEILMTTDPEELKTLTEELLITYNNVWSIYNDNDITNYIELIYEKEKRTAQALFFNEADSKKRMVDILTDGKIVKLGYDMMPIEDFKLRFYANGRIVTLVYDKVGEVGRNRSVLRSDGETRKDYYSLFYKPKGSDEFLMY